MITIRGRTIIVFLVLILRDQEFSVYDKINAENLIRK